MPRQTIEERLQVEIEKVEDRLMALDQKRQELTEERDRLIRAQRTLEESS
jgi:hypothetical protein